MNKIESLIEKNDRGDWYRYFRRSRCHETLDAALEAAEAQITASGAGRAVLANALLAHGQREQELFDSHAPLLRRELTPLPGTVIWR